MIASVELAACRKRFRPCGRRCRLQGPLPTELKWPRRHPSRHNDGAWIDTAYRADASLRLSLFLETFLDELGVQDSVSTAIRNWARLQGPMTEWEPSS